MEEDGVEEEDKEREGEEGEGEGVKEGEMEEVYMYISFAFSLGCGTTWHAAALVGIVRGSLPETKLCKYGAELYARLEKETGLATGIIVVICCYVIKGLKINIDGLN